MYFGAKNIAVSYGKTNIIKNLSVEIPRGLTTAIIGKNGSGKTTLLKTLGRLITPDQGHIELDEVPLSAYSNIALAKKLAMLPQSPSTPDNITVMDLVSLGRFPYQKLTMTRLSKQDYDAIRRVMMETNVWDIRTKKVADLSGGQRQRVWITLVLAQDSEIILLDEPTTYLDIIHQMEVLTLLKIFAKKMKKTVVYVLHDLSLVARFADQIIAMKDGDIVANGLTDDIFTESVIKDVFGITVEIGRDSYADTPIIVGVKNV
ncbi:ABC transporter ATP-binding protein [Lactococcus insecticola]|uniref:Iron ABC transporter ATP-binding protein n=1 Tax=Pseudolactococcus insecticola TaxID=2709158 RepID=A0A6A0B589_9LACT|nr:ABC transporter ATP-binding protein [Lactococcus insecticola]GFH40550.1 iron ABC transporter ATP-binding protein [Lactococcus insecticola]